MFFFSNLKSGIRIQSEIAQSTRNLILSANDGAFCIVWPPSSLPAVHLANQSWQTTNQIYCIVYRSAFKGTVSQDFYHQMVLLYKLARLGPWLSCIHEHFPNKDSISLTYSYSKILLRIVVDTAKPKIILRVRMKYRFQMWRGIKLHSWLFICA